MHSPQVGEVLSTLIDRSLKYDVLYLSIGAIKCPPLARDRQMMYALSPEKKINVFIGCF